MNRKEIYSTIKVLALGLALTAGIGFALAGPSASPPGDNVAAPINVGSVEQTKLGGLIVGEFGNIPDPNPSNMGILTAVEAVISSKFCLPVAGGGCITEWSMGGGALPAGTANQTLRHNGKEWVASSLLINNESTVAVVKPPCQITSKGSNLAAAGEAGGGGGGGGCDTTSDIFQAKDQGSGAGLFVQNNGLTQVLGTNDVMKLVSTGTGIYSGITFWGASGTVRLGVIRAHNSSAANGAFANDLELWSASGDVVSASNLDIVKSGGSLKIEGKVALSKSTGLGGLMINDGGFNEVEIGGDMVKVDGLAHPNISGLRPVCANENGYIILCDLPQGAQYYRKLVTGTQVTSGDCGVSCTGTSFVAPTGVTRIKVQAWGAGGGGGGGGYAGTNDDGGGGGGGGGGGYAEGIFETTPGWSYFVFVASSRAGGYGGANGGASNGEDSSDPSFTKGTIGSISENTLYVYGSGGKGGRRGEEDSSVQKPQGEGGSGGEGGGASVWGTKLISGTKVERKGEDGAKGGDYGYISGGGDANAGDGGTGGDNLGPSGGTGGKGGYHGYGEQEPSPCFPSDGGEGTIFGAGGGGGGGGDGSGSRGQDGADGGDSAAGRVVITWGPNLF